MNSLQKELLNDLIREYAETCTFLEREYIQGTNNSIKAAISTKYLKRTQLDNLIATL